MTDKQIKVGDVVPWAEVPSGAMVRFGADDYASRRGDNGTWNHVSADGAWWPTRITGWQWSLNGRGDVTIIAMDVPADASADDLRRLAEVFDVREALRSWGSRDIARLFGHLNPTDTLAARLHAAGWRPGMTAEDAARLLAEDRS